ncbi:MAG: 6-phosphofructokinase [Candidatus Omnitrophica bacterium]|nr:6-phosphofructokinase [Candidatus Omnitrophota bacterium]
MADIKKIAVLTSGGDAPGMNAAIRSVVRTAVYNNIEVMGIKHGYNGLIQGQFISMNARSVSNILSVGGTILKTSRSLEFMKPEGRTKAFKNLKKHNIDCLIVIGGNGSFTGAIVLQKEHDINIIGIPGTIDNDINGSDYTVGCSTALDTALDAIDKIRDTVNSMERIYVIEVMGREEPFLALRVALAGGAEDVIFPQTEYDIDKMCDDMRAGHKRGKLSWIIVVAEGVATAHDVSKRIHDNTGFEVRPLVLGHIQRGGGPNAVDRILASQMGKMAVEAAIRGEKNKMVGIESHKEVLTTFEKAIKKDKTRTMLNDNVYKLTKILSV